MHTQRDRVDTVPVAFLVLPIRLQVPLAGSDQPVGVARCHVALLEHPSQQTLELGNLPDRIGIVGAGAQLRQSLAQHLFGVIERCEVDQRLSLEFGQEGIEATVLLPALGDGARMVIVAALDQLRRGISGALYR
ncbi:hypothetical protein D3C76_758500 [compost metagenome]